MTRSRSSSKRFLPPADAQPAWRRQPWGPSEMFAEGQWQAIRVSLERQGWSASQIERLHDHPRQGWPLAMAKDNVANLTRQCPLRAHDAH